MSERRPDFRDLVGEDLTPEERERLQRVHDLLVAAGPPPELPPHLAAPDAPPAGEVVPFLPRRRAGLMLGLAAALALVTFVGGFIAGRARDTFPTAVEVPMHGTALASSASATIKVGDADAAGNWPLKLVDVHGLKRLPKGEYYEMFLTRHGKRAASCGTFRIASGSAPFLNAPYDLRRFDGWIVTIERPGSNRHAIVLTT